MKIEEDLSCCTITFINTVIRIIERQFEHSNIVLLSWFIPLPPQLCNQNSCSILTLRKNTHTEVFLPSYLACQVPDCEPKTLLYAGVETFVTHWIICLDFKWLQHECYGISQSPSADILHHLCKPVTGKHLYTLGQMPPVCCLSGPLSRSLFLSFNVKTCLNEASASASSRCQTGYFRE